MAFYVKLDNRNSKSKKRKSIKQPHTKTSFYSGKKTSTSKREAKRAAAKQKKNNMGFKFIRNIAIIGIIVIGYNVIKNSTDFSIKDNIFGKINTISEIEKKENKDTAQKEVKENKFGKASDIFNQFIEDLTVPQNDEIKVVNKDSNGETKNVDIIKTEKKETQPSPVVAQNSDKTTKKDTKVVAKIDTKPNVVAKTPEPIEDKTKVAVKPPESIEDKPKVAVKPPEPIEDKPKVAVKPPEPIEDKPKVAVKPPEPTEDKPKVAVKPPEPIEEDKPKIAVKPPEPIEDKPKVDTTPVKEKVIDSVKGSINIYFVKYDEVNEVISLIPKKRSLKYEPELKDAISELLKGIKDNESGDDSIITSIPSEIYLLDAVVENGTAYLNFNSSFEFNPIGQYGFEAQIAQIVWTATEFSNIDNVVFLVNGERKKVIGSEGLTVNVDFSRNNIKDTIKLN